jgi:hypothetical protein
VANVREDELGRRGEKPVMVSFVLLSWSVSGRTVLFHEELTIDVADEKLQRSVFCTGKTK